MISRHDPYPTANTLVRDHQAMSLDIGSRTASARLARAEQLLCAVADDPVRNVAVAAAMTLAALLLYQWISWVGIAFATLTVGLITIWSGLRNALPGAVGLALLPFAIMNGMASKDAAGLKEHGLFLTANVVRLLEALSLLALAYYCYARFLNDDFLGLLGRVVQ